MADSKKAAAHPDYAERIVKALPAKVRDAAEVVAGGGAYSILKVHGKSVASIRDRNVRIVHPTDGSADSLKALAKLIAEAAPEAKPEPKPKDDDSKKKAAAAKKAEKEAEAERAAEAKIEAAREAEASKAADAK